MSAEMEGGGGENANDADGGARALVNATETRPKRSPEKGLSSSLISTWIGRKLEKQNDLFYFFVFLMRVEKMNDHFSTLCNISLFKKK